MDAQATVGSVLDDAIARFRRIASSTPHLDAELLVGHVLELNRVQIRTDRDRVLDDDEVVRVADVIARREQLEPVQYILGTAHFRRLQLEVDPRVLVPRPETEAVVEAALEALQLMRDADPDAMLTLVDLCTGSGAIALAVADETDGVSITATDLSSNALDVAAANAQRLGLDVELLTGDLAQPVRDRRFHVVTVNPPYIGRAELSSLGIGVAEHEPHMALFTPDIEPTAFLRRVVVEGRSILHPGGVFVIEVGAGQAHQVATIASECGLMNIQSIADLAGIDRVVTGVAPSE